MTASPSEILAVAAVVWDQDSHSEADLAFLAAIAKADSEWVGALNTANITFGAGSEAWEAVKRLATRQRNAVYASAFAALEANDELEFAEAAE